jgi:hypothetical protein
MPGNAKKETNNRIKLDWQFGCAPLPAGYAERLPRDDELL